MLRQPEATRDNQRARTPTRTGAPSPRATRAERWLQLVSPAPAPASASFEQRERVRRGRLVGILWLAWTLIELGAVILFTIVDDDHPMMKMALAVALALTVLVAVLNRGGRVTLAALLLVALADLPLASIPATAFGGRFDIVDLGPLYLAAGSLLVAASALDPWSVFAVALVNTALMGVILFLMPHTPALDQLIASNNAQQAFAGPPLMQAIVALVAYFWARSVLVALRRADRAEEIAELERREFELNRDLEQGARELLATHVRLANGDFRTRVPAIRNPLLWQIGSSLNNLIGRLARLAQIDFLLRRTEQDAHRLAEAIRLAREGRQAIWPTPSGTPLDEVVIALVPATAQGDAPPPPPPRAAPAESAPDMAPWPFGQPPREWEV
ncbi:MAG TPA: hypothetical protein VF725_11045 [Ktedonobacterales bacterium]